MLKTNTQWMKKPSDWAQVKKGSGIKGLKKNNQNT